MIVFILLVFTGFLNGAGPAFEDVLLDRVHHFVEPARPVWQRALDGLIGSQPKQVECRVDITPGASSREILLLLLDSCHKTTPKVDSCSECLLERKLEMVLSVTLLVYAGLRFGQNQALDVVVVMSYLGFMAFRLLCWWQATVFVVMTSILVTAVCREYVRIRCMNIFVRRNQRSVVRRTTRSRKRINSYKDLRNDIGY